MPSLWENAKDDESNGYRTKKFYTAMSPWSAGSVYPNALSEDDELRFDEAYGLNYESLSKIKGKYDPDKRFRHNTNIRPKVQAVSMAT